jgi:hypothetical protein
MMSNEFEKVYIGDGVYARWNGMSVLLETERDSGTHYIYLEPQHVESIAKLVQSETRIAKRQSAMSDERTRTEEDEAAELAEYPFCNCGAVHSAPHPVRCEACGKPTGL